ncbi:DEAD/DEAH box helicase family protein [Candidatus Sumerlaeota bacterium]|nr:DEAD/DEAH box helicase family protein [Candidatus Sumerlaeota bacterium]
MIDIDTAKRLLDFGARIGQGTRANEQLKGAVAIHNILEKHGIAYLADEVGMGKTYVAIGALALFRHYKPDFRALVIAPRENIQRKWIKEMNNFAANNMLFPDLRFGSIERGLVRKPVFCSNLLDFVHEVIMDPRRDFFLRITSFSLPMGSDPDSWFRLRDDLLKELPWLPRDAFSLRSKDAFKDNFAQAICCAIPKFDLVIVDEAHNLKHGWKSSSARNRILSLALGRPLENGEKLLFPSNGFRSKRVLLLSATPIEETYRHLWNQLDVFGLGGKYDELRDDDHTDEEKKEAAAKFLIRRVTNAHVAGCDLTKNQYRREWRHGGVSQHDNPIIIEDDRQRLIVALVQKKVAELLNSEKFNMSFQTGMLASFESFLETTKLKRSDEEGNFDDSEQTDDMDEREGIDVHDINRLSRSYREKFNQEMPHPKMDAMVESLRDSWKTGRKSLVFVRRIASVWDLKKKLDEYYDDWLIQHLKERLPHGAQKKFRKIVGCYKKTKQKLDTREEKKQRVNRVGADTFFAWFFRGDGPRGVVSGANIQRRFIQRGAVYSTFFEENHVMTLLNARAGGVLKKLDEILGIGLAKLRKELQRNSVKYLSRTEKYARADLMDAAQAAALELLKERGKEIKEQAGIIWNEIYQGSIRKPHADEAPDVSEWLEKPTFFTEIRQPERAELRAMLWPEPQNGAELEKFRERQIRAQLLATAARLGHSLIDLYILTINRLGSIDLHTLESSSEENESLDLKRINEYLDLLDNQRRTEKSSRTWGAFDELSEIAQNYNLILDVNLPDANKKPLVETARYFGSLLRQQQPVGGMTGEVNRTLVQQFRMPGYPLVLFTTNLLQEGEDLHTFCSSVYHYGIAWTPSSMEQRTGRIDRVLSQTERRLSSLKDQPSGEDFLQVYYPYLEDTVEVIQVQRVLERMNIFLRLMHEGLKIPKGDCRAINVRASLISERRIPEPIQERLESSFPVQDYTIQGGKKQLAVEREAMEKSLERFQSFGDDYLPGLKIQWEQKPEKGRLMGTVKLSNGRIQPFALFLRSEEERLVARCISPIGRVVLCDIGDIEEKSAKTGFVRIGAILSRDDRSYDLTVEDDVILAAPEYDMNRISRLIRKVVEQAENMEQLHFQSQDMPVEEFEENLAKEGEDERD